MDNSTYISPEDSGLGESSRNDSNPSTLFTPTTTFASSRKRKILEDFDRSKSCSNKQSSIESIDSPWISGDILSSTLNESLTTGVEKCKIDNFAANYYTERCAETGNATNTLSILRKIKEPTTPAKTTRFCNNKASPRLSPLLKLGSPERNGILYPNLQPNSSRFSDGKRCSPAKKCLFTSCVRKDPVAFFYGKERVMYHIILKIFLQLGDEDLYASSKVCRNWKKAIMFDMNLKRRLQLFIKDKIMNKENYMSPYLALSSTPCLTQAKQSTPIGFPTKMYELTNSLTEGQHLEKCFACNKPDAVVDQNISQCTNTRCGAIRCLKCNSISKKGPESFHDKCQQSILLLEKPSPKYALLSSPKRCQNTSGLPAFLVDDSLTTSQSRNSTNSSGYITDSDMSRSQNHSTSFNDCRYILKTCNTKNVKTPDTSETSERRSSLISPVTVITKKIEEIIEPSSPPKVNHVACTKKSKRMLKRLRW